MGDSLDLQTTLHNLAGGFLVLIERVGVDVQRGRRLAVSEQSCNCTDIRAAGDEQACRRVAQAVDVQISRQVIRLEDFLKSPCEGRRCRWEVNTFSADSLMLGLLASVVTLRFRRTEGFVLAEQIFHFGGEVHITIASFRFRSLYDDLVAGRFDGIAADVDVLSGKLETICLKLLLYARFVLYHRNRQ